MPAPLHRQTLLSYLDDYVLRENDRMFVQSEGLRLVGRSYRQLVDLARRIARELESRGVNPGDRVLLCGGNSSEWISVFWGCLLRGVVVVPLDRQSTLEFVLSVQKKTVAKLVFADNNIQFIAQLPTPFLALQRLTQITESHSSAPYHLADINRNTLAEIVFTSGTTSSPKGVMLTHGNLLANLLPLEKEILKYSKWRPLVHPIRFLVLVPLSHVFGQLMSIFVPQLLGGEVHFDDTLNPAETVRRIRQQRISIVVLVPRMLESLREWVYRNFASHNMGPYKQAFERATRQSFLRRWWTFRKVHRKFGGNFWAFVSGGATLDNETQEFWHNLGFGVLQGYGMTETASLVTVTHPFKGRRGSIGKPLPGYELKLDHSGQILVRGPGVSPGYWLKQTGSDSANGGWLHTGDVGAVDEQGNLFFKGREKDVIVTGAGLNVYPQDLEDVLHQQSELRDCCVLAWPGEKGDEPLAVLILRNDAIDAAVVIDKANEVLTEHQKIRRWYVWPQPDFPRTPTEKILKREILQTIGERGMNERVESCHTFQQSSFIVSAATKIAGDVAPGRDEASLKLETDLKLDSLGRIELLSALEDRYEIELDEAAFT